MKLGYRPEDGLRVSRSGPDSVRTLRYRKRILIVLYKQIKGPAIWVALQFILKINQKEFPQ